MSSSSLPPLCTTSSSSSSCTISNPQSSGARPSTSPCTVQRGLPQSPPSHRRFAIVEQFRLSNFVFESVIVSTWYLRSLHRSGNSIYQFGRRAFLLVMFAMDVVTAVFILSSSSSRSLRTSSNRCVKKDRTRLSTSFDPCSCPRVSSSA